MRETVLAYRFRLDGAVPFKTGDPDDFARAQRQVAVLRETMGYHGTVTGEPKILTRPKPPDAPPTPAATAKSGDDARPFRQVPAEPMDEFNPNPPTALPIAVQRLPDDFDPVAGLVEAGLKR